MTIIINHREPSDIYFNGNISEVYYGQHLVWSGCKYKPGQLIINNSSLGTYNWQCLSPGVFEIIVVGGGGGGTVSAINYNNYVFWNSSIGGSGAGFCTHVHLEKGNYTYTVGAGGAAAGSPLNQHMIGGNGTRSSFAHMIANGGGGSESVGFDSGRGGNGGAVSTTIVDSEMIKIQTIEWNKAGNTGASKNNGNIDGTSIYQNYGKGGNGGFNHQSAGLAGVVQVKFISKR